MQHTMSICSTRGDTLLEWDVEDEVAVQEVRDEFDKMMTKGFIGYADGNPTREFDPNAQDTVVCPLIAGG